MRSWLITCLGLCWLSMAGMAQTISRDLPLKVAVVGMSHDHVHGILQFHQKKRVEIIGIVEADRELIRRYQKTYQLPDELFFQNLNSLLAQKKPSAVLAFNAINEHLGVVETCAPRGIPVMVEKPLATSMADANRIAYLSQKYRVPVLTNYETTWYNSNHYTKNEVEAGTLGNIRKMVVHSGHEGPKEIGCSSEFLQWLTDPVKNGGGASRDFGCYGANLMTWLMQGKMPVSVSATIQRYKPMVYPMVDDAATIVLEYPDATGIIEASWNWPYSIKDLEVFGSSAYLHALDGQSVIRKKQQLKADSVSAPDIQYRDFISYLEAFLRGEIKDENDLSSLANNLVVMQILEAATISAKEGRKVLLPLKSSPK